MAERPDLVGSPNTGIDPKTDRLHFLDVNAFLVQPANTIGNAERNVALGLGRVHDELEPGEAFQAHRSERARSAVPGVQCV